MRLISFILVLLGLHSCIILKAIVYNVPKVKNAERFPKRWINNSSTVFHFFEPALGNDIGYQIKVDERAIDPKSIDLNDFVKHHKTLSFLIIRNDSILFEKYSGKIMDSSLLTSFSLAKAFVSTLIGIAIDNHCINNVHQNITDFIPELKGKGFDFITIENLLKHTSGIRFTKQEFSPTSDNALFYYGSHLRKLMLHMHIAEPPGRHFNYQSENYQLLALIIERATGSSLSAYLESKIWKPMGMEHPAFWNIDNKTKKGMEKAFCCLSAAARDFAKLGRLYLNLGKWNGVQIVSENWIKSAIIPDTLNGGKFNFQYNWLVGPRNYGSYYAAGLYGQYIYIYPEKKLLIIRLGKEDMQYNPAYWKEVFLQIIDQL